MVSLITATIFKQTLVPLVNYLKCFGYGTSKDHSNEVRRLRKDATEDLKETQGLPSEQFCKPNICQTTNQAPSFIKNSYMPVRFYAEQSIHHPACPDFTKTRLHSLPITKSLENPVTCESPCSQFLGGCRWYSQQTGKGRLRSLPITKRLENPETCVAPWSQFLGGCRWHSDQTGNDSVKDAAARMNTQGGNLELSMGDKKANRGLKEDVKALRIATPHNKTLRGKL